MLYLSIRTWKEIPVLWPAYGLFPGHESRNGTKLVPLSIRWPFGHVMVVLTRWATLCSIEKRC